MKDPYVILEVSKNSSDQDIKKSYLEKIKLNPPDKDREKFEKIYEAYNAIKNEKSRIKHELFSITEIRFENLLEQAFHTDKDVNIDHQCLQKMLLLSIDFDFIKENVKL